MKWLISIVFFLSILSSYGQDSYLGFKVGPSYSLPSAILGRVGGVSHLSMLVYEFRQDVFGLNFEFGQNRRVFNDLDINQYGDQFITEYDLNYLELGVKYQSNKLIDEGHYFLRLLVGIKLGTPLKSTVSKEDELFFSSSFDPITVTDFKSIQKRIDRSLLVGIELGYELTEDLLFYAELGHQRSFNSILKNDLPFRIPLEKSKFRSVYLLVGVKKRFAF